AALEVAKCPTSSCHACRKPIFGYSNPTLKPLTCPFASNSQCATGASSTSTSQTAASPPLWLMARALEIGMIGREGMTGASVVLGDDTAAPHQTYMQVAGNGQRLRAQHLRMALQESISLHKALLLYVHALMRQNTDTALSNGRHKIEERLARWL